MCLSKVLRMKEMQHIDKDRQTELQANSKEAATREAPGTLSRVRPVSCQPRKIILREGQAGQHAQSYRTQIRPAPNPQHLAGLSRLEPGPNVTLGAKKNQKTKMKKT